MAIAIFEIDHNLFCDSIAIMVRGFQQHTGQKSDKMIGNPVCIEFLAQCNGEPLQFYWQGNAIWMELIIRDIIIIWVEAFLLIRYILLLNTKYAYVFISLSVRSNSPNTISIY